MNEEIERLREDVDKLIARSWAQEALLLFLGQRAGADDWGMVIDAARYSEQLRDHLRTSPLTDSQLAHFDAAMRGLLERLRLLGEKEDPTNRDIPY